MDIITQYITLDFVNSNFVSINAKQYDKDARQIIITCTDRGQQKKLSSSTQMCNIKMITPDNRPIYNNATINADGTVTVILSEDMLSCAGIGKLEIEVIDAVSKKRLSTMNCNVNIEDSVYPDDAVIASPEFNVLTDALLTLGDNVANSNESVERINKLEADITVAEESRVIAENTRKTNETKRQNAETSRTQEYNALKSEINTELTKLENSNIESIVSNNSYKVKVTNKDGESTTSDNLLNFLAIGTVETGSSDEEPTANITGDFGNQKLNLRLPSGKPFKIEGTYSSIEAMNSDIDNIADYAFIMIHTGSVEDEDTGKLYMKDIDSMKFITDLSGVQGIQGVKGEDGITPNLTIGTVETGEPNTNAIVTITGTTENPIINFVIPKGEQGNVTNVYAGNIPYESQSDENTIRDIMEQSLQYRGDVPSDADYETLDIGVWFVRNGNDTYGMPQTSMLYKPISTSLSGSFVICFVKGDDYGSYVLNKSTNKYEKLALSGDLENCLSQVEAHSESLNDLLDRFPKTAKTITDWNDATKTGFYQGNSASNAPISSGWFMGFVIAHSTKYIVQEVWQVSGGTDTIMCDKYVRKCHNGTWWSWHKDSLQFTENGDLNSKNIIPTEPGVYNCGSNNMPWNIVSAFYHALRSADGTVEYGKMIINREGTTSEDGQATLILGTTKTSGKNGNACGQVVLYNSKTNYGCILSNDEMTENCNIFLPKQSGTLALQSEVDALKTRIEALEAQLLNS